ncbi:MAG: diadenylate cyclase CdaA [Paludibacteraceae bacterium]|nr:diadenylate cyclase CdaA [Paludibacteraceae bacterium]
MRFEIRFIDIVDIVLVAILLYKTYKMLKGTSAIKVFFGILIFVLGWLVVNFVFGMQLMGGLMNQIVNVGAIALIVLFQEEIRRFLSMIGSNNNLFLRLFGKFFSSKKNSLIESDAMQIVIACKNLSKQKVGALIVFRRGDDLRNVEITGETINANISTRLIQNIFFKNSPLHDGAMIIGDGKIISVGCILPVSHSLNVPKECGLRHRAALGMSEKYDALCVIVSEETGNISVAMYGDLKLNITPEDLESILSKGEYKRESSKSV